MKKLIILIFLLFTNYIFATTINIPNDYSTIQAGLNAADSGDVVSVQAGTYYENIFWPDKNGIELIGQDSSNTTIDGGGNSCVIYINPQAADIDTNTLIKGFKITNGGNVRYGGGISILGCNPKLTHIKIANNSANYGGGGIYCDDSSPTILNSVISCNSAEWGGGGIYCFSSSSPILTDITIFGNSANNNGGGIYCNDYSSPTITDATILDNSANFDGGGICCDFHSSPTITDVTISGNSASYGGGIYCYYLSSPTILNSIISSNSANYGGGICCRTHSSPTITDVTILDNSANFDGGGIYCNDYSSPIITDATILDNSANDDGGGICCRNNSSPTITDATFINNRASSNGEGIYTSIGSDLTIEACNFIDQNYSIYNSDNSIIITATNNYFGEDRGPYHPTQNSSGQGDSVNAFVDIDPWLTSPTIDAPPIPIQNLAVKEKGDDHVTLSWTSSKMTDLNKYRIYYDTDTTDFYEYTDSIDVVKSDTTITISGLQLGQTYYFSGITIDVEGNESWYSKEIVVEPSEIANPISDINDKYALNQNYPNPFNPTTTISYDLPKSSYVCLSIYDINGKLINSLVNEQKSAGSYSVIWNASNISSGLYFYRIQADDFNQVKKCLLLK